MHKHYIVLLSIILFAQQVHSAEQSLEQAINNIPRRYSWFEKTFGRLIARWDRKPKKPSYIRIDPQDHQYALPPKQIQELFEEAQKAVGVKDPVPVYWHDSKTMSTSKRLENAEAYADSESCYIGLVNKKFALHKTGYKRRIALHEGTHIYACDKKKPVLSDLSIVSPICIGWYLFLYLPYYVYQNHDISLPVELQYFRNLVLIGGIGVGILSWMGMMHDKLIEFKADRKALEELRCKHCACEVLEETDDRHSASGYISKAEVQQFVDVYTKHNAVCKNHTIEIV